MARNTSSQSMPGAIQAKPCSKREWRARSFTLVTQHLQMSRRERDVDFLSRAQLLGRVAGKSQRPGFEEDVEMIPAIDDVLDAKTQTIARRRIGGREADALGADRESSLVPRHRLRHLQRAELRVDASIASPRGDEIGR